MNQKDRQKMCGNCDGRIPFDADICPYCTTEQTIKNNSFNEPAHPFETIRPLYPPLYSEKKNQPPLPPSNLSSNPPHGFMAQKKIHNKSSLGAPIIPAISPEEKIASTEKGSFWPILFLSLGANLLVLGILQLLFSEHGVLQLEWNSKHWFIYCLAGAPLFFFGFKKAGAAVAK